VSYLYMVFRWQIESRGHNFCSRYRPNHICYFFGPFVYQKNDHMDFGMISSNCLSYFFQDCGFSSLWRCNDESSLPFTNGGKQVNHSVSYFLRPQIQVKAFMREDRNKFIELDTIRYLLNRDSVHFFNAK